MKAYAVTIEKGLNLSTGKPMHFMHAYFDKKDFDRKYPVGKKTLKIYMDKEIEIADKIHKLCLKIDNSEKKLSENDIEKIILDFEKENNL